MLKSHLTFVECFPRIAAAIEQQAGSSDDYVNHRAIVRALISENSSYLDEVVSRDPDHKSPEWWANNMVQWFSKAFTAGNSGQFDSRFERTRINKSWAYRRLRADQAGRKAADASPVSERDLTIQPRRSGWRELAESTSEEHFELRFDPGNGCDWNSHVLVARVGRLSHAQFAVQFLIDGSDQASRTMREAVISELNYYLVELGEPDPWRYALYHCGTTANLYSSVHWSFHKGELRHSGNGDAPGMPREC